jgi:hypothetical protein
MMEDLIREQLNTSEEGGERNQLTTCPVDAGNI